VPCIEHHISEARKAGLTNSQLSEAIQLADKIRKVSAAKVLNAAFQMLGEAPAASAEDNAALCGQAASVRKANRPCCT
jgi:hypothetical protein